MMQQAHQFYAEIIENPNVFYEGLSPERATHIQLFYMISGAWALPKARAALKIIEQLQAGNELNESYWKIQLARAIAYGAMALKHKEDKYRDAAQSALEKAGLVDGFDAKTQNEIDNEYVLQQLFALK